MDTIRSPQLRAYSSGHWKAYTPEDTAGRLGVTIKTAAHSISQSAADGSFYMNELLLQITPSTHAAPPHPRRNCTTQRSEASMTYTENALQDTVNDFRLRGDEKLLGLSERPRRIPSPLRNQTSPRGTDGARGVMPDELLKIDRLTLPCFLVPKDAKRNALHLS